MIGRATALVAAMCVMAACTVGQPNTPRPGHPSAGSSSSVPPRVGKGVRVVVGGEPAVLAEHAGVLEVVRRILQLEMDYYAYAALPAPSEIFGLLTADNQVAGSAWKTGGDIQSPQRQGRVVVAVLQVARRASSGDAQVSVTYCQDWRELVYYSVDDLTASPGPPSMRIQPHRYEMRLVHTTGEAADGSVSDARRWLASFVGITQLEDPACQSMK